MAVTNLSSAVLAWFCRFGRPLPQVRQRLRIASPCLRLAQGRRPGLHRRGLATSALGLVKPCKVFKAAVHADPFFELEPTLPGLLSLAKVAAPGGEKEVGRYSMGDHAAAGDRYLLRIRLESLADGSEPSPDAAQVGQTALLYVKEGDTPEERVGSFEITAFGTVQEVALPIVAIPGDCDGDLDLSDFLAFQRCFTGPGSALGDDCGCADIDGDGDADLADLVSFQARFTGAK